jgi:hypothetical protein
MRVNELRPYSTPYGLWGIVIFAAAFLAMIFSIVFSGYFASLKEFRWMNVVYDGYANVFLFALALLVAVFYFCAKKIKGLIFKFSWPMTGLVVVLSFAFLCFADYVFYALIAFEVILYFSLFIKSLIKNERPPV